MTPSFPARIRHGDLGAERIAVAERTHQVGILGHRQESAAIGLEPADDDARAHRPVIPHRVGLDDRRAVGQFGHRATPPAATSARSSALLSGSTRRLGEIPTEYLFAIPPLAVTRPKAPGEERIRDTVSAMPCSE